MNLFRNPTASLLSSSRLGLVVCAALANSAIAAPRDPAPDQAPALAPFQGTWEAISYSEDGVADQESSLPGTTLCVEGDWSTFTRGGRTLHGRYEVDDSKSPQTLDIRDIRNSSSSEEGVALKGICEFDGDLLRIAISDPGQPRPLDFEPRLGVRIEVWRTADHAAREIVRETTRQLTTDYDNENLEGLLRAFEPNATRVDLVGQVLASRVMGYEGLRQLYRDQFARYPGSTLEVRTGSASFVSPDVIVADGTARLMGSGSETTTSARWFRVLHRETDAGWRISFLQITFPEK